MIPGSTESVKDINKIIKIRSSSNIPALKQRENKELCAAKHQKWTSSDVPKLVRREVLALRKMINHVRHL